MKLEHIALSISEVKEIKNFYVDILGMKEQKNFILKAELGQKIFNINKDTSVFFLQKDDLFFEVFLNEEKPSTGFNHICFSVKDREGLIEKSETQNYECIRIERDFSDLIFIKDKSGNIFEIK
ncbi:MAG: VOC family protein [Saprospiraceae bacterium]|nr:VOC family protein [Saprospiraceae bacterium]